MNISYSSFVQLYQEYTVTPSSTSAATTSSCVESGLLPVAITSAPAFLNTKAKYAVLASKCIVITTFLPAKGFVLLYSSSIERSTGIKFFTHAILS